VGVTVESSDLLALIGLIPPAYAPYAAGVCELIFALSVLATGVKAALGDPKPDEEPTWRVWLFKIAHVLDVLAINTATVRQKYKTARLEGEVKTLVSQPPGYSPEQEDPQ
jgi:hypothetical protein